jgi:probable F420-dependent oxidoreductase
MMAAMKVRFGVGMPNIRPQDHVPALLDLFEDRGIDSLWFSEVVHAPQLDPLVGMAYSLARTQRLKVGTGVTVLPGRHPVLVAKQLASLARIAPRRILPVFGVHPARPEERPAFPVPDGKVGAVFDESLVLVRELLTRRTVTFHGEFFDVDDVSVGFAPEKPLDLWLGGRAPVALRRIGRLADGWLASFVTPAEAAAGIDVITDAAAQSGRAMDDEHYGVSLAVCFGSVPAPLLEAARRRRPDLDPATFAPVGWDALVELVRSFTDAGVSKFVVRPALPPDEWPRFVDEFVERLHPLQA